MREDKAPIKTLCDSVVGYGLVIRLKECSYLLHFIPRANKVGAVVGINLPAHTSPGCEVL